MSTSTLKVGTDLAAELGDCEVGDTKTLSVTGTVTAIDDDGVITLDVTGVTYEHDEEEGYEEAEPEQEMPRRGKMPSAVLILAGKQK